MTDYLAAWSKCRPLWNCEKMRGQYHYLMPMSSIKYLLSCLWASNNKHARGIPFRQAWELIWKKNWNLGGPGHAPPPPRKIFPLKIYAICGYPDVIFMKIYELFYIHTATDWWPGESPHISRLQTTDYHPIWHLCATPLLYLNPKLGPVMYEIKIKSWKITAEMHTGEFQSSFPHKLLLPAQLAFFLHHTEEHVTVWGCAAVYKKIKINHMYKQSFDFECPTTFLCLQPIRPVQLPFTDTMHSYLLAQPQSLNISPRFTTQATIMVNPSLSKLLEHSLFLKAGWNDCIQT